MKNLKFKILILRSDNDLNFIRSIYLFFEIIIMSQNFYQNRYMQQMNAGYMVPDEPNQNDQEMLMNTQEHLEYQYMQQEQQNQDPRYQQADFGGLDAEQYEYINPFKKQDGAGKSTKKTGHTIRQQQTALQKQIKAQFRSQLDRRPNSGMQSRLKVIGNVHPSQVTNRVRTASSLADKELKAKQFINQHILEDGAQRQANWGTMRQRSVSPMGYKPQQQSPGLKMKTQRQDRRQWNPLTQSLPGLPYQSQGLMMRQNHNFHSQQLQDDEAEIVNIDFQDQQPDNMAQFSNIQQSQMFGQTLQSPGQSFITTHGPVSQFVGDQQSPQDRADPINEKQIQQMVFQYLNQRLGIDDNQFGAAGRSEGQGLPKSLQGINKMLEGMVDTHLINQIISNQASQDNHTKEQAKQLSLAAAFPQQNQQQQASNSDLDNIRQTTASLGAEIREMRKQIQDMQMSGSEKDAEIIQLNMHLTDEKRKIHELIRGSSTANLSHKSQHLSQRVNSKSDLTENTHIQQRLNQLHEENEQLNSETKHLKKKLESQRKQALTESKVLKKEIKALQSKIQNVPDHNSINQEKEQLIQEMEQKFKQRYNKAKQLMQESNQQLHDQLQQEKEALIQENKNLKTQISELQDEVQKALKIHKANQTLSAKYEHLKKEMQQHQNNKVLLEQTIESQYEKMSEQQKQLTHLESEKDKLEQIRKLELQKSEMQKSQSDLEQKICENCITNYQKFEECQLKLSESERKAERLENQLKNQKTNETENSEDLSNLQKKLDGEVQKNEKYEKEIADLKFKQSSLESKIQLQEAKLKQQQSIQNRTAQASAGKGDRNEELIQELQTEINQLNKDDIEKEERISELLQKQQAQSKEIQSLKQQISAQLGANALPSAAAEPVVDNAALEAAQAEIDRLTEELKRKEKQLAEKENVVAQMAAKNANDQMKIMEMMQQSTQLESELGQARKEIERNKAQLQIMEGLKQQLEDLTNGGKKKKEKKGLFGGSKKK